MYKTLGFGIPLPLMQIEDGADVPLAHDGPVIGFEVPSKVGVMVQPRRGALWGQLAEDWLDVPTKKRAPFCRSSCNWSMAASLSAGGQPAEAPLPGCGKDQATLPPRSSSAGSP